MIIKIYILISGYSQLTFALFYLKKKMVFILFILKINVFLPTSFVWLGGQVFMCSVYVHMVGNCWDVI